MSLTFKGTVVPGRGDGKKIGYPTANLEDIDPPDFFPKFGVYIVKVLLKEVEYNGLLSAGPAITFGEKKPRLEVYIIGLENDIYGEYLEIELIEKIRDIIKFNSAEELKEQIKKDLERLS